MSLSAATAQIQFQGPVPSAGQAVLVLTTAPDEAVATRIAQVLVEEKLAACVNLAAVSLSIYAWKGAVQRESEIALTIKTRGSCVQALAHRLSQIHPYEVAELLVLTLSGGSRAYLDWLAQNTRQA